MLVCRLFPYRINIYEVYSLTLARMTVHFQKNYLSHIGRCSSNIYVQYAIEKEVNICYFKLCSNQLSQCVLGVFFGTWNIAGVKNDLDCATCFVRLLIGAS